MKILALAYVYPPDAGSGTFRSLYFVNHWAAHGDDVTVVTVRSEDFAPDALIDWALCEEIDPTVEVIRAAAPRPMSRLLRLKSRFGSRLGARGTLENTSDRPGGEKTAESVTTCLKDLVSAMLSFPDQHSAWVFDAVRKGVKACNKTQYDCIYASGGPWSCLLAATLTRMITRRPLILDFRDPWYSNPNMSARSRLWRKCSAWLEEICVRSADRVLTNTEQLKADFQRRYPSMNGAKFVTVPNGFQDSARWDAPPNDQHFVLLHAGALYGSRSARNFLVAIADLIHEDRIPAEAIKIQFVGGLDFDSETSEYLHRKPLANVVEVIPRVPHAQALELQRSASAFLLFQSGFPLQIPRKAYEYMAMNRPILAIAESQSATSDLISRHSLGFVAQNDVASLRAQILALFEKWSSHKLWSTPSEVFELYSNRNLASKARSVMRDAKCKSLT